MCFHLSRDFSFSSCAGATFQSGFHALLHKSLSDSLNGSEAEIEGGFDVRVTPTSVGLMAICFQQDASMIDLVGSVFPSGCVVFQVLSLVGSEVNVVFLSHCGGRELMRLILPALLVNLCLTDY